MGRSRGHVLRMLIASGTTDTVDFNLKPGSHLVHASLNIGAAGPPLRVMLAVIQPRVQAGFSNTLIGGWIRGGGVAPARSGDVTWDGDIEVGTDMGLRFRVRNDTGAAHAPAAAFVVIE